MPAFEMQHYSTGRKRKRIRSSGRVALELVIDSIPLKEERTVFFGFDLAFGRSTKLNQMQQLAVKEGKSALVIESGEVISIQVVSKYSSFKTKWEKIMKGVNVSTK